MEGDWRSRIKTKVSAVVAKWEFWITFGPLAAIVAFASTDVADEESRRIQRLAAKEFLSGIAVLGAAFAATAIAVLALVAVWFDARYLKILKDHGGWAPAMRPFKVVAKVGLLASLVAVVGILLFPISPLWLQALILGLAGGLLAWSIVGMIQLVNLLFMHGDARAALLIGSKPEGNDK